MKVEYILTVPAIWTDAAKSHMIKAAEDAGFGAHRVDFHLVSEPESAASYTLKAIQPNNLSVSRMLYYAPMCRLLILASAATRSLSVMLVAGLCESRRTT
jgi:hypothetical protein